VTATTGNLTDSGAVVAGGQGWFTTSEANADIELGTLNVTGAITLSTTGATGDATVTNAQAANLAASTIGGNLSVTAPDVSLSGAVSARDVFLLPSGPGSSIGLGDGASGSFNLSTSDLTANLTASGTVTVGASGGTGVVDIGAVNLTAETYNLLIRGGDTGFSGEFLSGSGKSLEIVSTGNITDGANVVVTGNAAFTTSTAEKTIDLGSLNVTGTITLNTTGAAGDATIVNAQAINFAASTIRGSLTANATAGGIVDSGDVGVTGSASLISVGEDADIDMGTLNVTGTIAAQTNGTTGDATLVNAQDIDLSASTVGGNLTLTATAGGIANSGTLNVTGTIGLNTTADASLVNAQDINLAISSIGGNLTLNATTGGITDSGTVVVAGNASLISVGEDADIDMGTVNVTGTIALQTNGTTGDATIVNTRAVDLGVSAIGGNLGVTATTGNLTDSGAVVAGGQGWFTTSEANADI
jgi:hypothetical protein